MLVIWPLDKRDKLRIFIQQILDDHRPPNKGTSPKAIARVIGLLRHAAFLTPVGIHYTIRIQFLLNDLTREVKRNPRRWWRTTTVRVPSFLLEDLERVQTSISNDLYDPRWCRLIGLLVVREPTTLMLTDASYEGLGGWSSHLNCMWRLFMHDLALCGFPISGRFNQNQHHEPTIDPEKIHINIWEFVALIVQMWVAIHILRNLPVPPGGHRIACIADNTTCLSWLRYASRTRRVPVRNLARFVLALLSDPFAASSIRFQGKHLAGKLNVGADRLSRPALAPTWSDAMNEVADLRPLRTFLIPKSLLQILAEAFTTTWTHEQLHRNMERLTQIPPITFQSGQSRLSGTTSSLAP